jgi:AraC-like DNA-binding protein
MVALRERAIARRFDVNPTHFTTTCRRIYGETAGQRIDRLRVELAKKLMADGDLELREIEARIGLPWGMRSLFRRVTGQNPSAFVQRKTRRDVRVTIPAANRSIASLHADLASRIQMAAGLDERAARAAATKFLAISAGTVLAFADSATTSRWIERTRGGSKVNPPRVQKTTLPAGG